MEQITRTLVIEQEHGESGSEQSYHFMLEQRDQETLVLNIDSGVWKIDASYNELIKLAETEGLIVRICTDSKMYQQLTEDKLLDYNADKTEYREFSLLILETSEKCNMKCKYCFESAGSSGENMSCETAIRAFKKFIALDNCKTNICVEFNGGEALLNFDMISTAVPQILRLAEEDGKKVKFTIQTNGTLLTAEMVAFFEKYHFSVGVSLDGVGEFNSSRVFADGRNTFDKVLRGINLLKESDIHYSTISVIHRKKQYENIKELLAYTGCDQFRANLINTIGRGEEVVTDKTDMKELAEEYVEFCRQMLQDQKYYEANAIYYFLSLLLCYPFMCYKEPCGAGMNQLFVVPNGNIYLCQESCFIDKGCIGNVNSEGIDIEKNIKKNEWFQAIQSRRTFLLEDCKDCSWKHFCCSCPCRTYSETGTVSNKSMLCEFNKCVFSEFIWMIHSDTEAVMNFLQFSF